MEFGFDILAGGAQLLLLLQDNQLKERRSEIQLKRLVLQLPPGPLCSWKHRDGLASTLTATVTVSYHLHLLMWL